MAESGIAGRVAREVREFAESVQKPLASLITETLEQSFRVLGTAVERTGELVDSVLDRTRQLLDREAGRAG